MWRENWGFQHKCALVTMAKYMKLNRGDQVLDWGCGCGHMLTTLKYLFDIDGVGVDITPSVHWAKEHSAGTYCQTDGILLDWIPSNLFHAVVSFAAVYHLPIDKQCYLFHELLRVTRPGGVVFVAWMGTTRTELTPAQWKQCNKDIEVVFEKDLYPAYIGKEWRLVFPAEGNDIQGSYAIIAKNRNATEQMQK